MKKTIVIVLSLCFLMGCSIGEMKEEQQVYEKVCEKFRLEDCKIGFSESKYSNKESIEEVVLDFKFNEKYNQLELHKLYSRVAIEYYYGLSDQLKGQNKKLVIRDHTGIIGDSVVYEYYQLSSLVDYVGITKSFLGDYLNEEIASKFDPNHVDKTELDGIIDLLNLMEECGDRTDLALAGCRFARGKNDGQDVVVLYLEGSRKDISEEYTFIIRKIDKKIVHIDIKSEGCD